MQLEKGLFYLAANVGAEQDSERGLQLVLVVEEVVGEHVAVDDEETRAGVNMPGSSMCLDK